MFRKLLTLIGASLISTGFLAHAPIAYATEIVHKLVIHVDENDPTRMKMALNNAANVTKYYRAKGEEVEIEIVVYGPGLHLLRVDTSPMRDEIVPFAASYENISFRSCGNTVNAMTMKEGKEPPLLDIVENVPSGVVHLMERQEQGWSYVRP